MRLHWAFESPCYRFSMASFISRITAAVVYLGIFAAGAWVLATGHEASGSPFQATAGPMPGPIETDGSLDLPFDAGQFTNGRVSAAILQPDGKLLIGGSFGRVHGVKRLDIARLNPDGTLDLSFDPGDATPSLEVQGIALQTDGKIIVTRVAPLSTQPVSGFPDGAGRLTRLNSDGSLDEAFAPSHTISIDGIDDGSGNAVNPGIVHSIVVEPDGKIVAVGNFFRIITAPGTSVPRSGVARFHSDGSLDTSFDPGTGLLYGPILPALALSEHRGIHVVAKLREQTTERSSSRDGLLSSILTRPGVSFGSTRMAVSTKHSAIRAREPTCLICTASPAYRTMG